VSSRAVILAGGRGTRLAPYTTVLPKPLLPIGDRAILEVVVEQLRNHGFTELTFAVGHLSHLIEAVFQDGSDYGVSIDYHRELEPLGTAGALSGIGGLDEPFLMMNGDILTSLNYRELFQTHTESENALTIATHLRRDMCDYGILHLDREDRETHRVIAYEEKPETVYTVSMGVYVVDPTVLSYIPDGEAIDLPDLVIKLLDLDQRVGSYRYEGLWLDIGRHDDYEQATAEYEKLASSAIQGVAALSAGRTPA
jgi:NDP-mannose synthase